LALSGEEFLPAAKLVFFAHLPVMAIEGALTAAAVLLAHRVKPELFRVLTQ
jgi:cobalt/nickel transport system permease protein